MVAVTSLFAALVLGALPHPQDGPDADVRVRIDSRLVRVNIVMNLAFCDGIVGLLREDEERLHPVEHAALKDALSGFYRAHNKVTIDGVVVPPLVKTFEVADPDLSLLPLFPRMGVRALTKIRFVLEYPAKSAPQVVALVWGAFPPDIIAATPDSVPLVSVQAQLLARGDEEIIRFRDEEPEYVWHASAEAEAERFLPVPEAVAPPGSFAIPMLGLGLLIGVLGWGLLLRLGGGWPRSRGRWLGALAVVVVVGFLTRDRFAVEIDDPFADSAALPTRDEALKIFLPLHANIYRAFDYADESDIYDALKQSVEGSLLDSLYNQIYRSLIMKEEGGAVSRVKTVTPLANEVEEIGLLPPAGQPGFRVVARWQVEGVVHHWGHSHSRTNEYNARYSVARTDGGWRIAGNQVLASRRVDAAPLGPGDGK